MNTPRPDQPTVPVEEFFNAQSAEITTSGRALQRQLADAPTQTMAPLRFVPLDITSANTAQWALFASHTTTPAAGETTQPGNGSAFRRWRWESSTGRVLTRVRTYLDAAQFKCRADSVLSRCAQYFSPTSATRARGAGRSGR